MAQGSLLDLEKPTLTANVSIEAQRRWELALSKATRTGPNSAIFHESSLADLEAAAELGQPFAQYYLAQLYFAHALVSGRTVFAMSGADDPKSAWLSTDSEGVGWLEKSAEQGVALSEYELAIRYQNGRGIDKSPAKADLWLGKAAASGLAKAEYEYGVVLIGRGAISDAIKWNKRAAKQHYVRAVVDQYVYDAYKYAYVMNLAQLKAAATSGDAVAMRVLGIELEPGGKFPVSLEEALKYEMKAAELGDPVAQYNVGIEFWKGQYRREDDASGVQWLLKSAQAGYPDAQVAVGIAYGSGNGLAKNSALSKLWYERAVSQGSYEAADNLAFMYARNLETKHDVVKLVSLYDIGASQGDSYGTKAYMRMFGDRQVAYRNGALVATGK